MGLFIGHGSVLHSMRDNRQLPLPEREFFGPELQSHLALHDKEEFVLPLMRVPHKGSFDLYELDVDIIHLADDLGLPMITEARELLRQVYGFHRRGNTPLLRKD